MANDVWRPPRPPIVGNGTGRTTKVAIAWSIGSTHSGRRCSAGCDLVVFPKKIDSTPKVITWLAASELARRKVNESGVTVVKWPAEILCAAYLPPDKVWHISWILSNLSLRFVPLARISAQFDDFVLKLTWTRGAAMSQASWMSSSAFLGCGGFS